MNQTILKARSQQLAQVEQLARQKAQTRRQNEASTSRSGQNGPATKASRKPRISFVGVLLFALIISNTIFATGFFLQSDIDMMLGIREQQVVRAYEDRVTGLRMQVDRLRSSQVAKSGNINLQMQELMRKQGELSQRQNYVRSLASRADELGISAPKDKPVKTSALDTNIITGSIASGPKSQAYSVDSLGSDIETMNAQTVAALAVLEQTALSKRAAIGTNLRALGIKLPSHQAQDAVGGPYLPAEEFNAPDETFLDSAHRTAVSLEAFDQAKAYLLKAPLLQPIRGKVRISSKFGNRRDPFHGKSSFHSGTDFKAKTGTAVRATGAGKVIYAGRRGGYGNSVEIRHTNGLTTRYGHLSKIYVHNGAYVSAGQNIGAVGATGRATGPHLHYEVRNSAGTAKNPATFIRAGYKMRDYF